MVRRGMFDERSYKAALSYYGLPLSYERVFTQMIVPGSPGGRSWLVACDPERESLRGNPVWVQINPPHEESAYSQTGKAKKACTTDIASLRNISLDFEYPSQPDKAHQVGKTLAAHLVRQGFAHTGLPIEDSGAGCHLVLPLVPIALTKETAPRWNRTVHLFVQRHIQPLFLSLAQRQGGVEMDLEGFDISRLLSVPGTWRPTNPRKADCNALRAGYLRRWLPPYGQGYYPQRHESQTLTTLLQEIYHERGRQEHVREKVGHLSRPGSSTLPLQKNEDAARHWLEAYATGKALTDRSRLFQSLVSGVYLKFGEPMVWALAEEIHHLSGEKYEGRVEQELQRSLMVATRSRDQSERRRLA